MEQLKPKNLSLLRVLKQVRDVTLSLALMGEGLSQCTSALNLFNCNLSRKKISVDTVTEGAGGGDDGQFSNISLTLVSQFPS